MITDPPLDVGAVQETVAWVLPAVAVAAVGAPGAVVAGVTALDALEAGPVPTGFVAVTVKVYAWPLVKPVTVVEVPVGDKPPQPPHAGFGVTV